MTTHRTRLAVFRQDSRGVASLDECMFLESKEGCKAVFLGENNRKNIYVIFQSFDDTMEYVERFCDPLSQDYLDDCSW